jgi:hypothetical protein
MKEFHQESSFSADLANLMIIYYKSLTPYHQAHAFGTQSTPAVLELRMNEGCSRISTRGESSNYYHFYKFNDIFLPGFQLRPGEVNFSITHIYDGCEQNCN